MSRREGPASRRPTKDERSADRSGFLDRFEHEIHHRGQLYEMLGRLGVQTPPLYGLTEPEVKARSVTGA